MATRDLERQIFRPVVLSAQCLRAFAGRRTNQQLHGLARRSLERTAMTLAQTFRPSEQSTSVALALAHCGDSARILLVSSDLLRRRTLARSISSAGGSVTAVGGGDEALALLRV